MNPPSKLICFASLIGLLAGCASVPRDAGFDDVRRTVADRTGHTVQWRDQTAEDAAVDAAVRAMLQDELTVDEAVQVALLNNLNLQATYEELGISQAQLVQAGLLKNPVFSVEARFPARPRYPLEVDVFQDFMSIFLLPLRKKVAAAEFEATKLRVANAALDLAAEARSAFYTLQAAQQMVEMRRTVLEAAEASAEASQRLHDAGNITDLQLHSDQTMAAQARPDLVEAEADVVDARAHLAALMGLSDGRWHVAARLPDPPQVAPEPGELESLAMSQRLDVAAAKQEIEVAAAQLGLTRRSRLIPEIDVGAHFEREPDGTRTAGPSVELPVPIFDQGQAATARGRSVLRQAQRRYADRKSVV